MDDFEGSLARGEQAYLHVIENRPLHNDDPCVSRAQAAYWRCSTCGQYVTDRGPFEAHPDNNEAGHAPDCVRHAAELAAYRAEWGEQ